MKPIPYSRQDISTEDISAVVEALQSEFITQGPTVELFEDALARFVSASHAVAVNSATSALHIACLSLGVGEGDLVWTSPLSFVASANCALFCKASVDFVDVDPVSGNMCPECLERKLRNAEVSGRLPKVLIVVHFSGMPCPMERISQLARLYGVKVVEDASHALGASDNGVPVGGSNLSEIVIFSLHAVKVITTGEGGMATTNDDDLAAKMRSLRSHGITRDPTRMVEPTGEPWYYEQRDLGYNYRMTDIQAALGLSQLSRLRSMMERRERIAAKYLALEAKAPVFTPCVRERCSPAWHLYVVRLRLDLISRSKEQIFNEMLKRGVRLNVHYIPIHTHPFYRSMGFKVGSFPNSERFYSQAVSLPMYPSLTFAEQDYVIESFSEVLTQ